MSTWTYCHICEAALDVPTFKQKLMGYILCPYCGARVDTGFDHEEVMEELATKLEAMEAKIAELQAKQEKKSS